VYRCGALKHMDFFMVNVNRTITIYYGVEGMENVNYLVDLICLISLVGQFDEGKNPCS